MDPCVTSLIRETPTHKYTIAYTLGTPDTPPQITFCVQSGEFTFNISPGRVPSCIWGELLRAASKDGLVYKWDGVVDPNAGAYMPTPQPPVRKGVNHVEVLPPIVYGRMQIAAYAHEIMITTNADSSSPFGAVMIRAPSSVGVKWFQLCYDIVGNWEAQQT